MRLRKGNARSGFTLIEMLVVMAALGIAMFLGGALIVTTLKAERVGQATSDRVSRRMELARQFRDDVARAESAPKRFGEFEAGPTRLILRMPGGAVVLYTWKDDALERSESIQGKESHRLVPVGPAGTTIAFDLATESSRVVTLRITEQTGKGPAKHTELSAALGGNLR